MPIVFYRKWLNECWIVDWHVISRIWSEIYYDSVSFGWFRACSIRFDRSQVKIQWKIKDERWKCNENPADWSCPIWISTITSNKQFNLWNSLLKHFSNYLSKICFYLILLALSPLRLANMSIFKNWQLEICGIFCMPSLFLIVLLLFDCRVILIFLYNFSYSTKNNEKEKKKPKSGARRAV